MFHKKINECIIKISNFKVRNRLAKKKISVCITASERDGYDQKDTRRVRVSIRHNSYLYSAHVHPPVCTRKKRLWREMHKAQVPESLYSIESLGS